MSKAFKIIVYPLLFLFSFLVFLYWLFPYDVLKERITRAIEEQLGGGVEVDIQRLSPYWLTGVDVKGLTIAQAGGEKGVPLVNCKRARARVAILSLLVGSPSVSFDLEAGGGEASGSVRVAEDALAVDAELGDFDLGSLNLIAASTGLRLTSRIDGDVSLRIDRQRPIRSTGKIALGLKELRIASSALKVGGAELALPDLVIASGRESQIKAEVGKGTVAVEAFRLAGGDLGLDLKGKLFLSSKVENYRFNLNGNFMVSKKLSDALPFLFILEQQKAEDGSYPLTITGRLEKPSIKVGTFTVPL